MSSQVCLLCCFKSKIPIRDNPTRQNIEKIILNATVRAETKNFGKYKKENCKKLSTSKWEDLITNTAYHRSCYKDFTRVDTSKSSSFIATSKMKLENLLSNFIECNVVGVNGYVNIKTITDEYKLFVKSSVESTVRKDVKSYLQNRDDVIILRPVAGPHSEIVASRRCVETVFFDRKLSRTEEFEMLLEAFEKTRRMLLDKRKWKFEGNFKNFKVSDGILSIFGVLIAGKNPNPLKPDFIDKSVLSLVQYIEGLILSERQAKYPFAELRQRAETPLNIGIAIETHKNFRSKKLVDMLNKLGLAVSYDKLLKNRKRPRTLYPTFNF